MRLGRIVAVLALVLCGCGAPAPSMLDDEQAREIAGMSPMMLLAFDCDDKRYRAVVACEVSPEARRTARGIADGVLWGRVVFVQKEDGAYDLTRLFVVRTPRTAVLVDQTGQTYTGLEDFRDRSTVLGDDETLLVAGNIMTANDSGEIVAVARHRTIAWYWWLLGGLGVLVAGLVAVMYVISTRDKARFQAPDSGNAAP
ncbi:hypothetical protein [Lentzea sp. NPDC092896]|uniref:hypothetical protein n=1 Tax=Lentzea sp. NPDC092896 TaxID=3364127 RepID=UPI0037F60918